MTRDDIIRMAKECFADPDGSLVLLTPELTAFAALIAAAEREACAKVCEGCGDGNKWSDAYECAAAIRARSKT